MFNSANIAGFSNVFETIGERWMLITVKDGEKLNTMTASWGGLGVLWNTPVAFVFVRPQRYTNELLQDADLFTVSFYPEECRPALNLCGTKSGRDIDKIAAAGLTPVNDARGFVYFEQAERVLCLRKLYVQQMNAGCAIDRELFAKNYPGGDFHYIYTAKIEDYLTKL